MVAPFKTNTSQAGTTQTEANQIQWKVVNLDGTNEENMAKIKALTAEDEYVKIVMQTDWAYPNNFTLGDNTKFLILDLNGHTFYPTKTVDVHFLCDILEITDSSVAGNGCMRSYNASCGIFLFCGRHFILSGGMLKGCSQFNGMGTEQNVVISGGKMINWESPQVPTIDSVGVLTLFHLATYINTTDITVAISDLYHENFCHEYITGTNSSHAGFAVSRSDIVSGAYNYTYGADWNLAAGDCILEKLTQKDTPYYLWYRDSNSEPYHFLLQLV